MSPARLEINVKEAQRTGFVPDKQALSLFTREQSREQSLSSYRIIKLQGADPAAVRLPSLEGVRDASLRADELDGAAEAGDSNDGSSARMNSEADDFFVAS